MILAADLRRGLSTRDKPCARFKPAASGVTPLHGGFHTEASVRIFTLASKL